MTHAEPENLHILQAMIERLGDHWDHDQPLNPDNYEGMEHLVIFTYAMAGYNWKEFGDLLKEAKKELELMIELTAPPSVTGEQK